MPSRRTRPQARLTRLFAALGASHGAAWHDGADPAWPVIVQALLGVVLLDLLVGTGARALGSPLPWWRASALGLSLAIVTGITLGASSEGAARVPALLFGIAAASLWDGVWIVFGRWAFLQGLAALVLYASLLVQAAALGLMVGVACVGGAFHLRAAVAVGVSVSLGLAVSGHSAWGAGLGVVAGLTLSEPRSPLGAWLWRLSVGLVGVLAVALLSGNPYRATIGVAILGTALALTAWSRRGHWLPWLAALLAWVMLAALDFPAPLSEALSVAIALALVDETRRLGHDGWSVGQ